MKPRLRRVSSAVFVAVLAGIAGAGYWVGLQAQEAILDSQAGSISEFTLDPSAPGFRAFTEPTQVVLVLHTTLGDQGADLVGASILTPADAGFGGTVVTVPATFQRSSASPTLENAFRSSGLDAAVAELTATIASDFTDVVVLDGSSWTALMRADLPLRLSLSTDLVREETDGSTSLLVSAGARDFELLEVARVAIHRNPGEPSLGVALRHQEIWQSWIARTAGADERPDLFELDTGFSSVIGALASGEVSYRVIPTQTVSAAERTETTYVAQVEPILDLFAQVVPFPEEETPGDRATVLLLDSTLGAADQTSVVQAISRAGGRVTILGNTDGAPIPSSQVQLHDPAASEIADRIAAALGVVVEVAPLDDATTAITVVLAG